MSCGPFMLRCEMLPSSERTKNTCIKLQRDRRDQLSLWSLRSASIKPRTELPNAGYRCLLYHYHLLPLSPSQTALQMLSCDITLHHVTETQSTLKSSDAPKSQPGRQRAPWSFWLCESESIVYATKLLHLQSVTTTLASCSCIQLYRLKED